MWQSVCKAAAAYWAAIFALGFALGTARVLWLAPRLGETTAVCVELPLMLAASLFAARRLTRRYAVRGGGPALAMGALAFALLMTAEAILAVGLFGQSLADWLAALAVMPGLLGLAGQLAFAVMPLAAGHR
jgi:hypothetical protein